MLGNPRQGYTEPAPKAPGLSRAHRVARAVGGGFSTERSVSRDPLDLCELPLFVAEWAHGAGLEPALDAVQMEHVCVRRGRARAARHRCEGNSRRAR